MLRLGTVSILVALALSGCTGTAGPDKPLPEDPNPFTYRHVTYSFVMHFPAAGAQPSIAEVQKLQAFLDASSARPGDTVTIRSDATALGGTRRAVLGAMLTRAGLSPVPGVTLSPAPDTVDLVLEEMVVVPPHCGDWPVFAGDQPSNAPAAFLGCQLRSNLYQMVVDKRDLAVGRTPGPADAEPGMRAVQAYREGTPAATAGSPQSPSGNAAGGNAAAAANAAAGMANPGGGMSDNGP